ncbi:hypothetical protein GGD64_000506 [Bradyrhizobium sp. CIR3A]|uniref:hypothetical protein n=1 Tax=Bradyrhizobium sp. IAR9 TaxID=2663841 RepID=UPI001606114E|nr:hypothetical protein [Bradyrhizobium sp. IAR9]MBB4256512.1 hypothetical protein [Bradyrhizobium sp. CIR3A]
MPGFGNDNERHFSASEASPDSAKTAEADGVERGNSRHSNFSDAPEAAEMVEPSVANGSNAGNWPQAAQPAATALEPVQPAKVASEIGGAELAFRFDSYATPPTFGAVVELGSPLGSHVSPGQEEDLHVIGKSIPNAMDEHAVAPVHNAPHHAAPHDFLI